MRSLLTLLALLAFRAACAPSHGARSALISRRSVLDQVNGDRIQVWLPSAEVLELGDTDGIAGFFDTIRDPWGRISEALVNALFLRYDPASNSLSERDNGLFAISNLVGSSTALRALGVGDDQKYFQDLINFLRSDMGGRTFEAMTSGTEITDSDRFLRNVLPVVRNFVYTSPAFYELLPRPGPWPGDGGPPSIIVNVNGQNQTFAGADAAFEALLQATQNNTFTIRGEEVPWPLYPQLRSQADANVTRFLQAPLPVEVYTLVGTGNPTKYNGTWGNVASLSEIIGRPAVFENVDGDGTIPLVSAAAFDDRALDSVRVNANHDDLLTSQQSFAAFRKWLTTPPPSPTPAATPAAAGASPAPAPASALELEELDELQLAL
eukprot:tig00020710_g13311.t1